MLDPSQEQWGEKDDPEFVFERRWAIAQLDEAFTRCEDYFVESGRQNHWLAFSARILNPEMYYREAVPLEQLARELGFKDKAAVSAAVQLVIRRVQIFLREVVNDAVPDPREAESELASVIALLRSR